MMVAEVGDDVYREDPTVTKLEQKLAKLFGKESALYFPTGSMANQTAIKLHTQPGEQLIADSYAHIFNYECGGISFHSGVSSRLINGTKGMIKAAQVANAINPPDFYHSPMTRLVCLENTTNKGGGACYDLKEIQRIKDVCDDNQLGLHLDGARLWNALVAKHETPLQYGALFDTISVCLSKGLGAPMGSVLIGDQNIMQNALRVRKLMGGAMRQIGFMAAAGLYALEHHIERLEEDHKKAKEIEKALRSLSFVTSVVPVETNIIIFTVDGDASEFKNKMQEKNIYFNGMGNNTLRLVTHLDYTDIKHAYFMKTLNHFHFSAQSA